MGTTKLAVYTCIVLLLLQQASAEAETCRKLHVGSSLGSTQTYDDIVKSGKVNDRWKEGSAYPTIIGSSKSLEYFYLPDVGIQLTEENFNFMYNEKDKVLSFFSLKQESPGFYTLEVTYRCNVYGGTLVDYRLEINVDGCGTAMLAWKKLCGNPYTEREGLTVEMRFEGFNEEIVKNGQIVNANAFDMDVLDTAFIIPTYVDQVFFTLWVNDKDIKPDNTSDAHQFAGLPNGAENKFKTDTYVERLRVDSDQFLVKSELAGTLATNGAYISNITKEFVTLDLECQGWLGQSTIEIDIQLPHFKDITLYFVKKCEGANPRTRHKHSVLWWLVVAALLVCVIRTLLNCRDYGTITLEAIPYKDKIVDFVTNIKLPSFKDVEFGGSSGGGLANSSGENENVPRKREVNEDNEEELKTMNRNDPGFEDVDPEIKIGGDENGKDYGTF